ncbi:MAG TPA: LytR C-terminal domain-containing protein [Gemmatimonadaceae bacterium]|nr:LytR C-terminal domain-containing protein [Gemmatimonadaceae bacterium]
MRVGTAAIAATLVVAVGLFWRAHAERSALGELAAGPPVFAADGERIRVEVINATRVRGLARRATFALRDAGFDVVRYTTDADARDSTLVLDRSGHPEWARRVARALGGARVESRPDSSRYLDVTVLLGADWSPPSKPFHP